MSLALQECTWCSGCDDMSLVYASMSPTKQISLYMERAYGLPSLLGGE